MLNQVALMGRLTAEPELRHTTSNIAVASFTLAVNRSYVKQGAERQTDFIDIVAWRNTAEFICKYFHKGQMMALEGSIQTSTYTDRDGNNRKRFEVLANNVYFTESRNSGQNGGYAPSALQSDYSQVPQDNAAYSTPSGNDDFITLDDDDDLPF